MGLTESQLEARTMWVAALRSGKYQQTTGVLHREDEGMCCLGVLYDVLGGEWAKPEEGGSCFVTSAGNDQMLNYTELCFAGLHRDDAGELSIRNDGALDNFNTIADTIELLTLADTEGVDHGTD